MPLMEVNQVGIYYERSGEGPAVVFLHGYTGSGRDWRHQVAALSDHYTAVTVDCRGHGGSEAPASEDEYAIPLFARDVRALLEGLGIETCCLVGHSMGGFQSLQLVLDFPDRLRGLVLVDTSSGDYDSPPGSADLKAKLHELARNEGLAAAFEYDATHNPARIQRFAQHPAMKEVARQKVLDTSVDGYIYVSRSFGKWAPVTDRLGEIKVPTLIFLGDEDEPFIRPSQTMKNGIAGSKLVVVPGAGHNPHEEAPDLFNEKLLKFLYKINW